MKTWREILSELPSVRLDMPAHGDNSDKSSADQTFVANVATPGETESQTTPTFVTIVTAAGLIESTKALEAEALAKDWLATLGGGTARIIPPGSEPECGISWGRWMEDRRERIFAEARAVRVSVSNENGRDGRTSSFQRSFFVSLADLQAESEGELIDLARQQGIPREAVTAYWRSRQGFKSTVFNKDGPKY